MSGNTTGFGFRIWGDSSGAVNAVNQTNQALSQLESAVNSNWWGLQNLGVAFAALPAAVSAGIGASIGMSRDWEDSMFDVQRTSAATGAELAQIEQRLLAVARTTPLATTELAALAAQGAQLGVANADLADFAKLMGTLIASTDLTAANVGDFARVINVMGVPQAEWENFANTLIEVGRNTAATESEILNLARRLAASGDLVGLNTAQLTGLSAAILSLGPRAEAGATAIQKSFFDITRAVSGSEEGIETFAAVARMSSDEFRTLFRDDAGAAFAAFVTGLNQVAGGAESAITILDSLGIKEARQQQALLALASGTEQVGNEQTDLNAILATSQNYWANSTASADILEAKTQTLSGQLQLLKNAVFEAGAGFGNAFLPILKPVINFFTDFIHGLQLMPGPLKTVLAGGIALATGLSAIAAAALLIGPRLILARIGLEQLRGAAFGTNAALGVMAGGTRAASATTQQLFGAAIANAKALHNEAAAAQQVASLMALMSGQSGRAGLILHNFNRTVVQGTSFMARYGATIARTAGLLASLIAGMALFAITARNAGAAQEDAFAARQEFQQSSGRTLAEALQAEAAGQEGATQAALNSIPAYHAAVIASSQLGTSVQTLNGIIQGTASQSEFNDWLATVSAAEDEGSESATHLRQTVQDLNAAYGDARSTIPPAAEGVEEFGNAADGAAGDTQELEQELRKLHDALSAIAQAHVDYIQAQFAAREASLALAESERALEEAREAFANQADEIAEAERNLADARLDAWRASRDIAEAEENVGNARQRGLDEEADAVDNIADLYDSYLRNLQEIADLEEEIVRLRAGPTVEELTKATNKLRNAQLALIGANRKVADAEWYLQHLREENASARDIEDAEYAISVARQDSADAQQDINEAEEELAELRDKDEWARKLAEAELDLAAARREEAAMARESRQANEELADIRERIANDDYFNEAMADYLDALARQQDAIRQVADAEEDLADVRDPANLMRDLIEAELDYEQALYRVAEANTEVIKQQALMNGETWDAGRAAHTLAEQLGLVIENIPSSAMVDRMRSFIETLNQAPEVPPLPDFSGIEDELPEIEFPPIGTGGMLDNLPIGPVMPEEVFGGSSDEAFGNSSDWLQWLAPFGLMFSGAIGSILTAALTGSTGVVAGAGFIGLFTIIGVGIREGIRRLFPDWSAARDQMEQYFQQTLGDWFSGLPGKIMGILNTVWDAGSFAREHGSQIIGGLIGGLGDSVGDLWAWFGESKTNLIDFFADAGEWLLEAGGDILRGLWDGIVAFFDGSWLSDIGGWFNEEVIQPFKRFFGINSPSTLMAGFGRDIIAGLVQGLVSKIVDVTNFFLAIPGRVGGVFVDAKNWLITAGGNILQGMYDGALLIWRSFRDNFLVRLPQRVPEAIGSALSWLFNTGRDLFTGFWNGIQMVWNIVSVWFGGIWSRIVGFFSNVGEWLVNIGKALVTGFLDGITGMFTGSNSPVSRILNATFGGIPDIIGGFLGIRSPSTITREMGGYFAQGFIDGIDSEKRAVADAVSGMGDTALEAMAAVQNDLERMGLGYLLGGAGGFGKVAIDPFSLAQLPDQPIVHNTEILDLDAITTADPEQIVNEYVWAKRVRTRSGR